MSAPYEEGHSIVKHEKTILFFRYFVQYIVGGGANDAPCQASDPAGGPSKALVPTIITRLNKYCEEGHELTNRRLRMDL